MLSDLKCLRPNRKTSLKSNWPAFSALLCSILGFIGAPTAIASTVTGFLASTAGAATVRPFFGCILQD